MRAVAVMPLASLLGKFSIAGVVNSVVGYFVIFTCMALGMEPVVSNVLGYSAGFITSFLQARHWVFRSTDTVVADGLRFAPAFLIAFGANFLVLAGLLRLSVNAYLAQIIAGVVFIVVGFLTNYFYVFRKRRP